MSKAIQHATAKYLATSLHPVDKVSLKASTPSSPPHVILLREDGLYHHGRNRHTYNVSSLHDQLCLSIRYQLLKHIGEVLGHLFEGELDGFMLTLLQHVHQLDNGVVVAI